MELKDHDSKRLGLMIVAAVLISGCSATSDISEQGSSGVPAANTSADSLSSDNNDTQAADIGAAKDELSSDQAAILVANAGSVLCEASSNDFQDTMLAMVNASRQSARQCGSRTASATTTVGWSDLLVSAARNHASDMVSVNFFDHTGSDGLGVADRVEAVGYSWSAVGENIAAGQRNIAEVHQGWLDSPGHCRNIMNSLYSEIGAACIADDTTDFGYYWVVVFGNPR